MKKNIKMNKDQMEMSKYRAVIPYGDEEIVIKNINKELRNKIIELVAESVEKNEELDDAIIINMLIDELTNVEFEVPITEISEPSHHVSLIFHYINEILTELSEEILLASQIVANNKKVEIASEETKKQLIEEAKEIQERIENKKVENSSQRVVKKPSRRKGSVNRR